ncbi:PGR5-LIKE A, partial [Prunus dulcis]
KVEDEEVFDGKILQYCSIDKKGKKSLGELEQDFLQALQSFYYDGKAIMSNEEFDNLKEELMWEGSSVVMLKVFGSFNGYVSGNPILTDEEYDKLKMRLKTEGSDIVVEGPRCSLRTRKVYSDLSVDYLKMLLLNVPATLPEPYSFIFTWFAAVPVIVYLAQALTKLIVRDVLILKVQRICLVKWPLSKLWYRECVLLGTILSISNGGATNTIKCSNCGTPLVYDSNTRLITLPEGSNA